MAPDQCAHGLDRDAQALGDLGISQLLDGHRVTAW
jgi:hypothetical protein